MNAEIEHFPADNLNPVLSMANDGTVLYSNEAGESLLHEWGVEIGGKLPSTIGHFAQYVISRNNPEKMEIKLGKRVYLVVFHPLPEQECVNISGFDISNQKELEEELQLLNEDLEAKSRELSKVNEALRKSESKYRHIIEIAREGIWLIDRNDRTVFVNQRISDMLGYSIDEILGQLPKKFLAPEFLAVVDDRLLEHRQKVNQAIDYRFIRKDGSELWCIVTTHQLFDNEGKYAGSLGMLTDITERKKAEEVQKNLHDYLERLVEERTAQLEKAVSSLKESEGRLAEAQEMAHIGSWNRDIITGELHWSDEMYRIFGFKPQEFEATYNLFLNCVHPDDRDYIDNAVMQAVNGELLDIEYRIVHSGDEHVVHAKAEVIFDERDNPVRMRGVIQDITERKRAEKKLRESEEKYRIIVETANEGIVKTDSEAVINYVNKKMVDMLGYTLEEGIGRPIWDFICDEYKPIIKLNLEKKKQGISESDELKLIRKDGSYLWTHINAKPLFDKKGKYLGAVSMLTDITKRKEAEEALANIEIARKKEIHHRIKNNLQVISSLLDLQADKFNNRECIKYSDVLEAFKESQDRVISMALIHEELHKGGEIDTLDFSQYIVQLVDNLFRTYKLGNENISLNMNIDEDILFDMDTSVPLGIIVNELVSNSLKYAFVDRDKGEIQIKLHREESKSFTFILSISDNGVGIPEDLDIEDLDSLGLQLVTTLVEQLDGELELNRNSGTEFIVRFTVSDQDSK